MKALAPVTPAQFSSPGLARNSAGEFTQRIGRRGDRHGDADEGVGDARDRREILRLVRQVVVQKRMRGERRGRRHQQDVVVLGADEGGDADDAVAAGLVLDHHRLVPFLGQSVRQETRADIGAAAGAERQDEADRARRPSLRLSLRLGPRGHDRHSKRDQNRERNGGQRSMGAAHGSLRLGDDEQASLMPFTVSPRCRGPWRSWRSASAGSRSTWRTPPARRGRTVAPWRSADP